jgi:hypothetical protein
LTAQWVPWQLRFAAMVAMGLPSRCLPLAAAGGLFSHFFLSRLGAIRQSSFLDKPWN